MDAANDLTIGQRVARARRARGLTQLQLANLVGLSHSWLTKAERGERPLDRMSLIVDLARALKVDVTELTGQPYRPDNAKIGTPHSSIPAIRRALLGLSDDDAVDVPVDLTTLRVRSNHANHLRQNAAFGPLGEVLPSLLEDLHSTVAMSVPPDRLLALELLAEACHAARAMLKKLGYLDLAWVAVERAASAANERGDRILMAANSWNRLEVYAAAGATTMALSLALRTIADLDGRREMSSPAQTSLLGMMHLKAGLACAYLGKRQGAWSHMEEAERAARLLGGDRNDYQTMFGPTNTLIHKIGVSVEFGDGGHALKLAQSVNLSFLASQERRARFHLDIARAHVQVRHYDGAARSLVASDRAAPEYLRNHPLARELVNSMMRRARRAISGDLRGLASKLGVV